MRPLALAVLVVWLAWPVDANLQSDCPPIEEGQSFSTDPYLASISLHHAHDGGCDGW